ncbi:26S proteasome non-ATPase regulatory subunit 8 [Ixodes scapularis]|uniref:26S proteasome non-ATPase regulatory subunit 8 n=1 Tax=Ixodes scapularis TaxID=6945 RepID=UPI001161AF5E|nr:26S proteasome non-ATPase regulatory subunit 8 [Ixodes scapularis]
MTLLDGVVANYQLLTQEWSKKTPNLEKCGELLTKLKVTLTQLPFLPTSNTSVTKRELLVARDILEIGAQWSIATRDIPSFERYMAQLKCYYLDYQNDLPESAYKYQLLGLNLLCLLAQNRVAEFHTELELLPAKEIQSNVYISHPVSMEQFLMEGSYNKVFLSKGNVPSPSYTFFTDILLDTVRDEIASCVEKAYERISGPDVTRMLFLEAPRQTAAYATKRGWTQASNTYQFSTEVKHTDDVIPTEDLAAQTIGYARELEMIV